MPIARSRMPETFETGVRRTACPTHINRLRTQLELSRACLPQTAFFHHFRFLHLIGASPLSLFCRHASAHHITYNMHAIIQPADPVSHVAARRNRAYLPHMRISHLPSRGEGLSRVVTDDSPADSYGTKYYER